MTPQKRQYGTWDSPLSPKMLAGDIRLMDVQWSDDGTALVWAERRNGKGVLVMQNGIDAPRDMTDSTYAVGGGVGYGGGEFTVSKDHVYFVASGRLYQVGLHYGLPKPAAPDFGDAAAPIVSPDGQWVAFVHSYENQDGILITDTAGSRYPRKLAFGTDFVMQPAWHPQKTHLAFIAWNHPNMPWNGTQLRLATLAYDTPGIPYAAAIETLAGDENTAIFQPTFSPDGRYLAYISDATGWGHIYLYDVGEGTHQQLTTGDHEYGAPAWIQGVRQYGWTADSSAIYALRNDTGVVTLWRIDIASKHSQQIDLAPYTHLEQISVSPTGEHIACIASSATIPPRIIAWNAQTGVRVVRRATTESLAPAELARIDPITWRGHDGEMVHGLYFPPTNPHFAATGKPPLIVLVHGGPTSQRFVAYSSEAQFFATRGYAVLYVNHRGSTGYGKAYMNQHAGKWGVYDVEDSMTGAQHLVTQGLADPEKLVIMGGSAGGYTVLQSLVDKPGFYKAGINAYGIANQFTLVLDTHKFEARYSDWLLGALPEAAAVWRDRSPLFAAHNIKDACLVFQGSDDKVVAKDQSDVIVAALKKNNIPHEYVVYDGEGHGWRKPNTIEDYYNRILRFLMQHVLYA
jgi:dipeptidyl aminopeptidase/acylaminoacyl peptidase